MNSFTFLVKANDNYEAAHVVQSALELRMIQERITNFIMMPSRT